MAERGLPGARRQHGAADAQGGPHGHVLGGILSLTNLYIGLKAGWGFGVTITACIVSYGVWSVFLRLGLVRTPMTILENNCMQSTSSAAGYSTGSTLVSAFAAYYMINGQALPLG